MNSITSIKWDIEPNCNLKCKHCMISKVQYPDKLTLYQNKLISKKLIDCGVKRVVFQTKEPLLYDNIDQLISFFTRRGILTGLITNGTLLDHNMIQKLIDANLSFLAISLEGISSESNDYVRGNHTFEKVISNIKILDEMLKEQNKYIQLALEICLHSGNINEVDEMIDFFNTLPFHVINIGNLAMIGEASNNQYLGIDRAVSENAFNTIFKKYVTKSNKKYDIVPKTTMPYEAMYYNTVYNLSIPFHIPSCSVQKGVFSLSSNGQITGCNFVKDNLTNIKYETINNFIDASIDELDIIVDSNMKLFKSIIQNNYVNNYRCESCTYKNECKSCPIVGTECHCMDSDRCNDFKNKLTDIFTDIVNQKLVFSFSKDVYLELDVEKIKIYKIFIDCTIKETLLGLNYREIIIKLYNKYNNLYYHDYIEYDNLNELIIFLLQEGYLTIYTENT